jgi:hypothetical protein
MIIHIYIDVYKNTLARNPDSFMVMVLLSEDMDFNYKTTT